MPYADSKSPEARASSAAAGRRYYARNREAEVRRAARWNREHATHVNQVNAERRSQRTPMEVVLWRNAKNRSVTKGIPFDLEVSDIVVPEFCPVLGLRLKVATGCARDNSPSLDRVDTNRGYLRGNVRVISHKANSIKNNATAEDLERVLAYVRGEL